MSVLALVLVPQILNQVNQSRGQISGVTLKVLYQAGEIYLDKHQSTYHIAPGNTFCITLQEMVEEGELETPILDANSGSEISLSKVLKFSVNQYNVLVYEEKLYDASQCQTYND